MIQFVQANALSIPVKDGTFHAVVTSPPYWNLRDYGTASWSGGDPNCAHKTRPESTIRAGKRTSTLDGGKSTINHSQEGYLSVCRRCGARRVDSQLGLEPLHDCLAWATGKPLCGQCFICNQVAVFREVKRVLRDDGVLFLNIGDSYNGSGGAGGDYNKGGLRDGQPKYAGRKATGLKPKDMALIPQRLALALQADGWFVRAGIVWHKPNPMPGSQRDRPLIDYEKVWQLTKSERYYWDAEAVREENAPGSFVRYNVGEKYPNGPKTGGSARRIPTFTNDIFFQGNGRSMRAVWSIPTQSYSGAHYATYPEELVLRCLKAATSEKGVCPSCGTQWVRVVDKTGTFQGRWSVNNKDGSPYAKQGSSQNIYRTVGWLPGCNCYEIGHIPQPTPKPDDALDPETCDECNGEGSHELGPLLAERIICKRCKGTGEIAAGNDVFYEWQAEQEAVDLERAEILERIASARLPTVPAFVFDPFSGSGTTLLVAKRLGLRGIGIDLSHKYITRNAVKRIGLEQPLLF